MHSEPEILLAHITSPHLTRILNPFLIKIELLRPQSVFRTAMAFFGGRNVFVEDSSSPASVPENIIVQPMFYLNCIDSITNLNLFYRLTEYRNWRNVTPSELAEIMVLCVMLDRRTLAEKWVLIWDKEGRTCRPGENRFFAITDREVRGFIDGEVMIGGQRTRITQVIAFENRWIKANYLIPLAFLCHELGITSSAPSPPRVFVDPSPPRYSSPTPSRSADSGELAIPSLRLWRS
jgi:hypothetical protein